MIRRRYTNALGTRIVGLLLAAGALANGDVADAEVVFVNGVAVNQGQEPKHEGFSVRKEAGKFNDAFEDFARYRDKKAWELAFRSLETLSGGKREGMVPAGNGFLVPSRQRILTSLTSLPPEGKQAFRLFYDARAKQLFERAETALTPQTDGNLPVDEVAALREVFEKYFISSVGDRAADRFGDALFEAGDFAGAAAAWGAVLTDYPETSLSRPRLLVKRCTALARAGQWELFEGAARPARSELAGEKLTIGGKPVNAVAYLESLRAAPATAPAVASAQPAGRIELPREDKPAWQIKLLDDALAKKLDQAVNTNNWNAQFSNLRSAIPASATDGQRVYVNWLGVVIAADATNGKLLWRTRKFGELGDKFQNFVNMMADTDCYSATVMGDRLLVTGINLDRLGNYQESVRLVCMATADGKVRWSSSSGSLSSWSILGTPAVSDGVIYVAARKPNAVEVSLLAIGPEKGELLWQVLLGTAQGGQNPYRGDTMVPTPVVVPAGGMVYVITNNGALVAVDAGTRQLAWAFTYESPPVATGRRFVSRRMPQGTPKMGAAAFLDGATLYVKEEGGSMVHAVDVSGPSLLWKRPLDSGNTIVPLGDGRLLSVGQDLGAIDTRGPRRAMQWSTPMPELITAIMPLVGDGRVFAFAPRGVFEIDLARGDTRRIFRGADRDSIGGDLLHVPGRLVTVSNAAVTAYPTND